MRRSASHGRPVRQRPPSPQKVSKRSRPSRPKTTDRRWAILVVVLALGLLAVVGRSFVLQVERTSPLKKMAEEQYLKDIEVPGQRGAIFDRSGSALAISNDVSSVFAHPRRVHDARAVAAALAHLTGQKPHELEQKLTSDRMFVWLSRRIDPRIGENVTKLNLAGVGVVAETRRYYPNRSLFSHVLGGVDVDGKGIEGLEATLDSELRGEPVSASGLRDARGRTVLFDDVTSTPGRVGNDLALTVDRDIQQFAVAALAEGVEQVKGKGGSVIVANARTGEVLALANYPEFNPNLLEKVPIALRRNRAASDFFEPGSTFKTVVMAAALEEGVIRPFDQIFCENGRYPLGGEVIHDVHPLGLISAQTVISSSSNIGAAKIGVQVGRERLARYINNLGFGEKTGIELPGETPGLVRPAKKWPLIQLATVSFGQGISVTALQLAQAYATVANSGVRMPLHLVDAVISPDGKRHAWPHASPMRVMSDGTAASLNQMLQAVVSDEGTGARAQIKGVAVAGKTATAQKPDPVFGGYASDRYVANFAGFVPANAAASAAEFVIVVVVDEPQKPNHFGAIAAAPIFQKIALFTLQKAALSVPGSSLLSEAAPASLRGQRATAAELAKTQDKAMLGVAASNPEEESSVLPSEAGAVPTRIVEHAAAIVKEARR